MINSAVDTWNEPLGRAADIERTIRRQYLLRGYEMGRGGGRLGPEDAVAFLEEHSQAVEADINESTREELHELRRMLSPAGRAEALEDNLKAVARRMVQDALPNWRSARVDALRTVMQQDTDLWGIRFGGRRGVAFLEQNPPGLWDRLRGRSKPTARVCALWEDGTTSALRPEATVEWCILPFPSSSVKRRNAAGRSVERPAVAQVIPVHFFEKFFRGGGIAGIQRKGHEPCRRRNVATWSAVSANSQFARFFQAGSRLEGIRGRTSGVFPSSRIIHLAPYLGAGLPKWKTSLSKVH